MSQWALSMAAKGKLWWALVSTLHSRPIRSVLRNCFSIRLELGGIPVYIAWSDEGFQVMWDIISQAETFLREHAPLWAARMPRLLQQIFITDIIKTSAFSYADKCCLMNLSYIHRHFPGPEDSAIWAASALVYCLSHALLLDGSHGNVGILHSGKLAFRAYLRF